MVSIIQSMSLLWCYQERFEAFKMCIRDSINTTLKKENGERSAFRNKWNVYVSSLTSSEVLELQHDLFMRTDLIPQEAKEEICLLYTSRCV